MRVRIKSEWRAEKMRTCRLRLGPSARPRSRRPVHIPRFELVFQGHPKWNASNGNCTLQIEICANPSIVMWCSCSHKDNGRHCPTATLRCDLRTNFFLFFSFVFEWVTLNLSRYSDMNRNRTDLNRINQQRKRYVNSSMHRNGKPVSGSSGQDFGAWSSPSLVIGGTWATRFGRSFLDLRACVCVLVNLSWKRRQNPWSMDDKITKTAAQRNSCSEWCTLISL